MRKFREMLEFARTEAPIGVASEGGMKYLESKNQFFNLSEQAQPFVFQSTEASEEQKQSLYDSNPENIIAGAPFPVFSVEMLEPDRTITSVLRDDFEKAGKSVVTHCLLCYEHAPGHWASYAYCEVISHSGHKYFQIICGKYWNGIVDALLERMERDVVGSETMRERVKIGIGKNKRVVTYSNLIHIRAKKSRQYESSPTSGKAIDWTYRFAVRGHWRKIPGKIGKNRQGDPQKDFTWVSEHIRGPENAPMIHKTRVVT